MAVYFHDTINFISKLNSKKIINAVKVYRSFLASKRQSVNKHMGMPIALSIEPTTSCNLRCPECISGLRAFTRPTGNIELGLYRQIINELKEHLIYLNLYFQGEPYLHPEFLQMVSYANANGIYTSTSTNAHYLDQEKAVGTVQSGLDRLIISMDGVTQDSYKKYRIGGKLDKVRDGIANLTTAKKELKSNTPHIILQFIVFQHNQDQISQIKYFSQKMKIDQLDIKTAQINDPKINGSLIPSIEQYSRYAKESSGEWSIKNRFLNECWKMWHSSVITWDGRVVPCCFDKDADHALGSINGTSFRQIWEGKAYNQFRSNILKSRSSIDMCRNCTEGTLS